MQVQQPSTATAKDIMTLSWQPAQACTWVKAGQHEALGGAPQARHVHLWPANPVARSVPYMCMVRSPLGATSMEIKQDASCGLQTSKAST